MDRALSPDTSDNPDAAGSGAKPLVIFDCDGVLVDSEVLTTKVEVALLAEYGWNTTPAEVIELFLGRSDSYMLAEVERRVGRELPDWLERYNNERNKAFRDELTTVEGVVDAIDHLESAGFTTCVASSGTHEKMRFTLGLTGLWDRFEGRIFSATQVEHGKPAPDLFLFAAAQMGRTPSGCVVVEDSPAGVAAARAAAMTCVAYASEYVDPAVFADASAVITSMSDLPPAIEAAT